MIKSITNVKQTIFLQTNSLSTDIKIAKFNDESKIKVELSLGGFIYSILVSHLERPTAPLKFADYNKHIQKLSGRFVKSEKFDITDDELLLIKHTIDDDEIWNKTYIIVSMGEQNTPVPITSDSILFFKDILQTVIDLFEKRAKEEKKEKEKEEKSLKLISKNS